MYDQSRNFKIKDKKYFFQSQRVDFAQYTVKLPSQIDVKRNILETNGAAVMIPRNEQKEYFLVRQFRTAARKDLLEFPAGGIEKGETPKETAHRELKEEIGYESKKLTFLLSCYASPGLSSEIYHIFLAENLIVNREVGDWDEDIVVKKLSEKSVFDMIISSDIVDAKTILSMMFLKGNNLL